MANKQDIAPRYPMTTVGYGSMGKKAGFTIDEKGHYVGAGLPGATPTNYVEEQETPVATYSPFYGSIVDATDAINAAENKEEYIKTLQDIYQSVAPSVVNKNYDQAPYIWKGTAGLAQGIVGGAQKAGAMLANTAYNVPSLVSEYISEKEWQAKLHNYSKEDVKTVYDVLEALTNSGMDMSYLSMLNMENAEYQTTDEKGNTVTKSIKDLTSSQKNLLADYQELLNAREDDIKHIRYRQFLGDELDGKLYLSTGVFNTSWGYRNTPLAKDAKQGDSYIYDIAEEIGAILPEAAGMLTSGGTGVIASGTARVIGALGVRNAAKKAATKLVQRGIKRTGAKTALEKAAVSDFLTHRGKNALASRIAAGNFMSKYAKYISGAGIVSSQGMVFSQAFIRGYEDMRTLALSKGKTFQEANKIGLENGLSNGISECIEFSMFKKALHSKNVIGQYLRGIVAPEAIQEGTQTLSEDLIKIGHGLEDMTFADIALDVMTAAVLGGLGGAIFSLGSGLSGQLVQMQKNAFIARRKELQEKKLGRKLTDAETSELVIQAEANQAKLIKEKNDVIAKENIKKIDSVAAEKIADPNTSAQEKEKAEKVRKTIQKISSTENISTEQQKEAASTIKQFREENKIKLEKQITAEETAEGFELSEKEQDEITGVAEEQVINEIRQENNEVEKEVAQEVGEKPEPVAQEEKKPVEVKSGILPDLADALVGEQFKLYAQRHLETNPNASNLEIRRGWKAVKTMIQAYGTSDFAKSCQEIGEAVIENINLQDNYAQARAMALNASLDGLLNKNVIKEITSNDPAARTNAKWKLAEDKIVRDFVDFGDEATGKFVAGMFKNMYYDYSMLYDMDPIDIYIKMKPNMINLNRARLNNQLKTLGIKNIFDNVTQVEYATESDIFQTKREAEELIESFNSNEANKQDGENENYQKNLQKINMFLFGTSDFSDNFDAILNPLLSRTDIESNIYNDMKNHAKSAPWVRQDGTIIVPSRRDFAVMALLRSKGMTQEQIAIAFGMKFSNADLEYKKSVARVYPRLNREEMNMLKNIMNYKRDMAKMDKKDKTPLQLGSVYGTADNLIVTSEDLRNGQLAHEATHWLITHVLKREAALDAMGLPGNPRVKQLLSEFTQNKFRNYVPGDILSEEYSETIVDALFTALDGVQSNARLNSLESAFMEMKHELNLQIAHPERSKYPEIVSKLRKADLITFEDHIVSIFSPAASQDIINRSDELQRLTFRGKKKDIINAAMSLLNQNDIPDGSIYKKKFEDSRAAGITFLEVQRLAQKLVVDAKVFAAQLAVSDNFIKEKDAKGKTIYTPKHTVVDEQSVMRELPNVFNFSASVALPQNYRKPLTIGDMGDPLVNVKRVLRDIEPKKKMELAKEYLSDLLHSLTGSLYSSAREVSPELEAICRDTIFEDIKRGDRDQNLIKSLRDLIYKHTEIPVRDFEDFEMILWNGEEGSKKAANKWLLEHLGEEDGYKAISALQDLRNQFYRYVEELRNTYGIDLQLNDDSYFPRFLQNRLAFAKHHGHETYLSEISKIEEAQKRGEITEIEKLVRIAGIGIKGTDTAGMTAFHSRTNRVITRDEIPFYANIFEAATYYMRSMSQTIMQRNLFGRIIPSEENKWMFDPETGSLRRLDFNEIMKASSGRTALFLDKYKHLKASEQDEKALQRFEKAAHAVGEKTTLTNPIASAVININTMVQLTRFQNTINQLGEILPTALRFGPKNTIKNMFKVIFGNSNEYVTVNDVLAGETEVDILSGDKYTPALKKFQSLTGFSYADRVMKEMTMNAGLDYVIKGIEMFDKDYNSLSVEDKEQVIDARNIVNRTLGIDARFENSKEQRQAYKDLLAKLKKRDIDDPIVLKVARNILTELQPLDIGARPILSNSNNAFVKAAYLFKTVAARQASYLGHYILDPFSKGAEGKKIGMKRLANFVILALLFGVPRKFISDIISNRVPKIDIVDDLASPFFLNRYFIAMSQKEGPAAAVSKLMGFDVPFVNHLGMAITRGDISYLIGDTPVIGPVTRDFLFNRANDDTLIDLND